MGTVQNSIGIFQVLLCHECLNGAIVDVLSGNWHLTIFFKCARQYLRQAVTSVLRQVGSQNLQDLQNLLHRCVWGLKTWNMFKLFLQSI